MDIAASNFRMTPEPEPPPTSHPAEVSAGLGLAVFANLLVFASVALLLKVEDGARIRPIPVALGAFAGIALGVLSVIPSAFGLRDRGLSRRLAWTGLLLGLAPLPLAFAGMRLLIWYKQLVILD